MNKLKLEYQLFENKELIDAYKCIATVGELGEIKYVDKERNHIVLTVRKNKVEISKSGSISYIAHHQKGVTHLMNIAIRLEDKENFIQNTIYTSEVKIVDNIMVIDYEMNAQNYQIKYKLGGNNVFNGI